MSASDRALIYNALLRAALKETGDATRYFADIDRIRPGFVTRDEIAWIGTHRHGPSGNQIYTMSYVFAYPIDAPLGTHQVTLPNDSRARFSPCAGGAAALCSRSPGASGDHHGKPLDARDETESLANPASRSVDQAKAWRALTCRSSES